MYATQQQLPVSPTQPDGSTFNNNLPHGNDVWPQISFPQQFGELASAVVANFRMYAQSRATKSPVHCFAYNLLAQNRFSNQLMQEWCQRAVDFAVFLVLAQRNDPNAALQKTMANIYPAYLSVVASNWQDVARMAPQEIINGLIQASQQYQGIQQDLQIFKTNQGMQAGTMYQQPMGGGMQGGQLPPIMNGMPQYQQPVGNNLNGMTASAPANYQVTQPQVAQPTNGGRPGMYLGEQTKSWTAGQPLNTAAAPQGAPAVNQPATPEPMHENYAQTVDDLVLDPDHFVPRGFVIDRTRPFDEIHNPGGIIIRPAYQVEGKPGWAWSASDDQPYRVSYDHEAYILFYAKWPEGRVREVVVAHKPSMDYLFHEIKDELRAKAIRPKGVVVADTSNIIDLSAEAQAKPLGDVVHELDGHIDAYAPLNPVVIEQVLSGATDLDAERNARLYLRSALELSEQDKLPPHEYRTFQMHPLELSQACYEQCQGLNSYKSHDAVATKLQNLLDNNVLPVRAFRFLDKRLTKAINDYLVDSLSIKGMTIDSYVSDIKDLGPYLAKKKGEVFQKAFDSTVETFLRTFLEIGEVQEEDDLGTTTVVGVVDLFINFQAGWTQQDLESLQLGKEPKLISAYTHPRITAAIHGIIKRAHDAGINRTHQMRVVTADGVYYQVIRGQLVDKAVLLKQL